MKLKRRFLVCLSVRVGRIVYIRDLEIKSGIRDSA